MACLWFHPRGPRDGVFVRLSVVLKAASPRSRLGAAAHQVVVVPGASGEVLAGARSIAGSPRQRCVERGSPSVRVRPNWTVPVGHLAGRTLRRGSLDFVHEGKCAKSAVESAQSRLLWRRHRARG